MENLSIIALIAATYSKPSLLGKEQEGSLCQRTKPILPHQNIPIENWESMSSI